jgi:phosphate/sulfate permease
MCSALIMINILIFALPMSTTQVVISGLAAITLIYLPNESQDIQWFFLEVIMWIIMPVVGLALAYGMHNLVRKHIFEHEQARRRIMILIPWYICFAATVMFFMSMTKNFIEWNRKRPADQLNWGWYTFSILLFPVVSLVCARWWMLRRGRALNKVSLEYYAATFMKKEVTYNLADFIASLRIWDNSPILEVYFDEK